MGEKRPKCPKCGHPLSITAEMDDETHEITIEFFCEGPRSDEFRFQILTGLTWGDLESYGLLEEEAKTYRKEMGIKLLRRVPDE